MKKTILIYLTVFVFGLSHSQNAYYDAIFLRNKVVLVGGVPKFSPSQSDLDAICVVLNNYMPQHDGLIDQDSIRKEFGRNVFIKDLMPGVANSSQAAPLMLANLGKAFSSPVGGMDITTFADGIGKFLADRTKEEINIAFFDKFKIVLQDNPELAQMFPATSKYLNVIMTHEYSNMLSSLREAFERDLKNIPQHIISLASMDKSICEKCSNKDKKIRCEERIDKIKNSFEKPEGKAVIISLIIINDLINKKNPADILTDLASHQLLQNSKNQFGGIVKIADVFSTSLRSQSSDRIWITTGEIESLVKDPIAFKIYIGLMYQTFKNEDVKIGDIRVAEQLNILGIQGKYNVTQKYIVGLVSTGNALSESFLDLKKTTADNRAEKASVFLGSFKKFMEHVTEYETLGLGLPPVPEEGMIISFATGQGLEIAQNILAKNYSAAILSSVILLDEVLITKLETTGSYCRNEENIDKINFKQGVLKYGTFMANVINAENSDDVKKAIQAVALPPGSSSIKKNTNFNIALQAYTGISVGREVPNLGTPANQGAFFNAMSIYAPVGISFSTALKSHKNPANKYNAGSLSAMFTVIDVGAIFAYRFKDPGSTLGDSIKIRLENIIAPGLNVVYGIPKVPISIGTGIQWQPSLVRLTNANATITNKSGVRWQIFLTFDLPVLNLYTSKR